jgi:ATP-dependent DNA helicase PIF1
MATNSEEQREFAKWVLNVGDGSLPAIVEEEGVDPDWIKIPSHMRLPTKDCSLRGLIRTIYSNHRCHSGDAMYLMQRNILAPKNTDVDEVNNAILESLSKKSHTYLSANSLIPIEEGANVAARVSMDSLYPVEFLNTLQFNDIANHELELKVGVPILLLCNLNQSIGLCNGTRLIVKKLVSVSLKRRSSQGTMSTNVCSYPASSCAPPGLIGHLFCVVVNFLFDWHLR